MHEALSSRPRKGTKKKTKTKHMVIKQNEEKDQSNSLLYHWPDLGNFVNLLNFPLLSTNCIKRLKPALILNFFISLSHSVLEVVPSHEQASIGTALQPIQGVFYPHLPMIPLWA
jgi:hypothetical protein